MQYRRRETPQCHEESTDQGASAGQYLGCGSTEPLVVQRPADEFGVITEAFRRQRCGYYVPQAVDAGLRCRTEVIRPRQHGEVEVLVGFQVVDQCCATADIGVLQLAGGTVPDDRVEVGQCRFDGVVAAGSAQNGVAGEPHSTTAGVGGRAAELLAGLQQCHRKTLPRSGVGAGDPTTGADDDNVDGFVELSFVTTGHRVIPIHGSLPGNR